MAQPFLFAQTTLLQPRQVPQAAPPKPGKVATSTQDMGWPRQVSQNGSVLVYYQPQVDERKDYKVITGRMAFYRQRRQFQTQRFQNFQPLGGGRFGR